LRECFVYERGTGRLYWKHRPRGHFSSIKEWKRWNTRFAGEAAGHERRHCRLQIADRTYAAHRIVWKLVTGNEPPANIDHKNGDSIDNRWVNLRAADQTKQNWNKRLQKNNTSGYRGVSRDRNRWRAFICVDGIQRAIGNFRTVKEAAAAYEIAARQLHGEFYRR
jgi:hypothetical protein